MISAINMTRQAEHHASLTSLVSLGSNRGLQDSGSISWSPLLLWFPSSREFFQGILGLLPKVCAELVWISRMSTEQEGRMRNGEEEEGEVSEQSFPSSWEWIFPEGAVSEKSFPSSWEWIFLEMVWSREIPNLLNQFFPQATLPA